MPAHSSVHRLHPVSVKDALVASLRERILAADLAPEVRIPEAQLATEYGVARPTVRSAIDALVHEGFLRREAGRSARVPRIGPDDVRDLFLVRVPLELAVVDRLIDLGTVPETAEEAIGRMRAADPGRGRADLVAADIDLHRALVAATASPRLARAYGALQAEIQLALSQTRPAYVEPAALAAEHRELLDAIRAGDRARAAARMHAHLARAITDLTAEPDA